MTDIPGRITEHLTYLRAGGYSPRTITARADVLHRLHKDLPHGLAYAATTELEAWLAREDWQPWTRATYAMHVRAFYRWATGPAGLLDGDPAAALPRVHVPAGVPNPVSDAELAHALEHSGEPWHAAILLAAYAGLRAGEIAQLRREDVTAEHLRIQRGKGGRPATVPCHAAIWAHVEPRPRGPVVCKVSGGPASSAYLSATARRHFDRLGMPDVHLHRFRHWYATALLDSGANLRTVQELMRHRSVTSTQGYTAVRGGARREAVNALPQLG